jgi:hypothetical protein
VIADLHCHYPMHLPSRMRRRRMHPDTSLNALVKKVRNGRLVESSWPRS